MKKPSENFESQLCLEPGVAFISAEDAVSHSVHQTLTPSPQGLSALPLRPYILLCIIVL